MHELARIRIDALGQHAHQRNGWGAGGSRIAVDLGDIEQLDTTLRGDSIRRRQWNEPNIRFGLSERRLECQHLPHMRLGREDRRNLRHCEEHWIGHILLPLDLLAGVRIVLPLLSRARVLGNRWCAGRRLGLIGGQNNPQHQIDQRAHAAQHGQHENQSYDRAVDSKVAGQAAAYTADHAVAGAACKYAVHTPILLWLIFSSYDGRGWSNVANGAVCRKSRSTRHYSGDRDYHSVAAVVPGSPALDDAY